MKLFATNLAALLAEWAVTSRLFWQICLMLLVLLGIRALPKQPFKEKRPFHETRTHRAAIHEVGTDEIRNLSGDNPNQ